MQVLVRADAGLELGTGHIMRCLTLLDSLGTKALFVCTNIKGHLGDLIVARGHDVHLLEAGLDAAKDAAETAARAVGADLVIVDHYGLDAAWERTMPAPVMVIDDLADRAHDCVLLLDQNLGRTDDDYDGLVPEGAMRLTGPRYALLRPEFARARPAALAARGARSGPSQHVLIAMGGTDAPNATTWVLEQMAQMDLPVQMTVTAILGATAPHLDAVRNRLRNLPCRTELQVGTNCMAELMAQSDLAIGAAGSTSWERCTMGLPTVVVVIADNQISGATALAASGAALKVNLHDNMGLTDVMSKLLASPQTLTEISKASAALCDGLGAVRVSETVANLLAALKLQDEVKLRYASCEDAEAIWMWRHAGEAWRHFRSAAPVEMVDHINWFHAALKSPERILLIGECREEAVSHVRADLEPDGVGVLTIYIAPDRYGQGLGKASIRAALSFLRETTQITCLRAEVSLENLPSAQLFESVGFDLRGQDEGFYLFEKHMQRRNPE